MTGRLLRALPALLLLAAQLSAAAVKFEGNEVFSRSELAAQMALPDGFAELPPQRQSYFVESGSDNVLLLYRSEGYFGATVGCRPDTAQAARWICRIDEGPLWSYGDFRFESDDPEILEELPRRTIRPGDPAEEDLLDEELENFAAFYRDKGFLHVRGSTTPVPDTLERRVDIVFRFEAGARVRMGTLSAEAKRVGDAGRKGLSDPEYLRSLWKTTEGEPVSGKRLTSYRRRLLGTGLFRSVQIRDSLRADGNSDLKMAVVEKQPGVWTNRVFLDPWYLGAGVETGLKYRNFFGRFHEGSMGALVSQHRQRFALGYGHPLFLGTDLRFDDKIYYNQEDGLPIPGFDDSLEVRYEVRNRSWLTKQLASHLKGILAGDVRHTILYAGHDDERDSLERTAYTKLAVQPILDLAVVNDAFDPTSGFRARLTLTNGGRVDNRFTSLGLETRSYVPLSRGIFWAFAIDGGLFFDEGDRDDAKVFYQGGFRSVRGYAERSVYPRQTLEGAAEDGGDVVKPGLAPRYLRVSNEFRLNLPKIPVLHNFQLVQFVDWARVQDRQNDVYEADEQMAVGAGIHYRLPFLTLRLDYTFKRTFKDLTAVESFAWNRFSFDLSQAI